MFTSSLTQNKASFFKSFIRHVLPSPALGAYVARLFLNRFFLILILLVIILQMLDLLNRSEEILSAEQATRQSLLIYINLRLPELLSQFIPFAILLATLFTLASLGQSSEITIMRAAGFSASQIMAPILAVTAFIALGHGLFHDFVTVQTSQTLFHWRADDFRIPLKPAPVGTANILLNDGNRVIQIGRATRTNRVVILDQVTLYERDENGDLVTNIEADYAQFSEGKWALLGVRRFDLKNHKLTTSAREEWAFSFPLQLIFARMERPDHARFFPLIEATKTLKQSGMETFSLETSLYHRLAMALSSLLMPLLGSFVAFGTPRGGARIGRIILGMAVGFSYFVFDNYMSAMGSMGIMPPAFATLSAFAIYLGAGLTILSRAE